MLRAFLLSTSLALAALPAQADIPNAFAQHLHDQGYENITVQRTWLGRARIIGERSGIRREVILNPKTGEILRDYSQHDDGSFRLPGRFDDDEEDEEEREEDEEEDEDEDDEEEEEDEEDAEEEDDDEDDEEEDDEEEDDDEDDEDE